VSALEGLGGLAAVVGFGVAFLGLGSFVNAAVAVSAAGVVPVVGDAVAGTDLASGRPARVALGDRLEKQDRTGDGRVERSDRAAHRDPHEQVAALAHRRSQALAFAADHDRQGSAQIALAGGQGRIRLRATDAHALRVQIGESGGQVIDGAEQEMLRRHRQMP
jgi:hypothetical protein